MSCDAGPMHAAAALGTRVVALFGPTLPERTGPWGASHLVLPRLRPPAHDAYRAPDAHPYMQALEPDAIVEAVFTLLKRSTNGVAGS